MPSPIYRLFAPAMVLLAMLQSTWAATLGNVLFFHVRLTQPPHHVFTFSVAVATVPPSVPFLDVKVVSSTAIYVNFTAPLSDGGSSITNYKVCHELYCLVRCSSLTQHVHFYCSWTGTRIPAFLKYRKSKQQPSLDNQALPRKFSKLAWLQRPPYQPQH